MEYLDFPIVALAAALVCLIGVSIYAIMQRGSLRNRDEQLVVARAQAYAASKGAMVAMIRALAVEMARHGVTANSILPGWIETEMTAKRVVDQKFAGAVLPRIPVRRWGARQDFAGIAVYLASDASSYHTGDSFVIDGAYTIF